MNLDCTLREHEFDHLRRLYLDRHATPAQEYAYFDMIASGQYDHQIARILDETPVCDGAQAGGHPAAKSLLAIPQGVYQQIVYTRMILGYCSMLRVRERKRKFKHAVPLLVIILMCSVFFRYSHHAGAVTVAVSRESNYYTLPYSFNALRRGAQSLAEVLPADSLRGDIGGVVARWTDSIWTSRGADAAPGRAAGPETELIVDNLTLEEAAGRISARFGVRVILADECLRKCVVHGRFMKSDGLHYIIGVITGELKANVVVGTEAVVIGGGLACN